MQSSANVTFRSTYGLLLTFAAVAVIQPLTVHAGAPAFGPVGPLSDKAPTSAQLCAWLPVAKVNALLHTTRTEDTSVNNKCTYASKSAADIQFEASQFKSVVALTKWIGKQGGKTLPSPAGILLYSLGFDMVKGKVSGAWFVSHGSPVELEFSDGRDDKDAVLAVVAAAK